MKKATSKVTAWVLALLMVVGTFFASASTAFAANEGTLNIHKLSSVGVSTQESGKSYWQKPSDSLYYEYLAGATYSVYKIGDFTQTTAGGTVSTNYTAVSGLVDTSGAPITLTSSTTGSSIDVTASGLTVAATATSTSTGPVSITTGLNTNSVYLVKETSLPSGVSAGNDFIITVPMYVNNAWTNTVDAFPKNAATDGALAKTIAAIDGAPATSAGNMFYANIGSTIGYAVSVTVPTNYGADYTKFNIVDTSSQYLGLQYTTNPQDGVTVSGSISGTYSAVTDYTAVYVQSAGSDSVLTITFTAAGLARIQAGETLSVSYNAKVLTGADTVTSGISNNARIDFTKNGSDGEITPDPKDPADPDTKDPVIRIYSYGVKKVNETGVTPLAGAAFVLTTKDAGGNYQYLAYNTTTDTWDVAASEAAADHFLTSTTGTGIAAEAILQFKNLDPAKTYYLVETAAPTGYAKLPGDVAITATSATTDSVYNTYDTAGTYVADTGYTVKIRNMTDSSLVGGLPSTGGNGIYLYLIAGLLLIGGAVVLYVRSRKKYNAVP